MSGVALLVQWVFTTRDHTVEAEVLLGMASVLSIPWSSPARRLEADPRNLVFAVGQQSAG